MEFKHVYKVFELVLTKEGEEAVTERRYARNLDAVRKIIGEWCAGYDMREYTITMRSLKKVLWRYLKPGTVIEG